MRLLLPVLSSGNCVVCHPVSRGNGLLLGNQYVHCKHANSADSEYS